MPKAKRKVSVKGLMDEVEFSEQPNETVIIIESKAQTVVSKKNFTDKFEPIPEATQEPTAQ